MKTFQEFIEKRFFTEVGIGAPGTLPPGGPGGAAPGLPPGGPIGGGAPPPMGGIGGGAPPGLGGPPMGGMGAPGGDMTGKKPLELKPLNVWEVLEKILGIDDAEEEDAHKEKPQPKELKHLQG